MDGVAAEQVGVGHALAAVDLRPVVHAAQLGPALLGDGRYVAVQLQDQRAGVVAARLVAVDVGAHVGVDIFDVGLAAAGATQEPAEELDGVAAHIHRHAAAGAMHVPEPARMRTVVLLSLLD